MNAKRFRVIFSRALRQPVVVSEVKSHRGKAASSHRQGSAPAKFSFLQPTRLVASVLLALCAMTSVKSFAQTLPSPSLNTANAAAMGMAGIVVDPTNTNMTITQGAGNAVINWNSFDIGQGNSVNFQHVNASDATLNRVMGGSQSQIDGVLSASGRVFLLNPNGVLFGKDARVNVGGLVVSTQAISNDNFMGGTYAFSQAAGTTAGEIINHGTIVANGTDGFVVLSGAGNVTNTGTGALSATKGTVQMAQGKEFTLTMPSKTKPFLSLKLTGDVAQNNNIGVHNNKGTINAANVELKAKEGWVKSTSGVIEAKSIAQLVNIDNDVNDRNGSAHLVAENGKVWVDKRFGNDKTIASIKADKDIVLAGKGGGVYVGDSLFDAGRDILLNGNSQADHGVYVGWTAILNAKNNIIIDGTSNAKHGVNVYGGPNIVFNAGNDIRVTGNSEKKYGVNLEGKLDARKNIAINGRSISDHGTVVYRGQIYAGHDINIDGTSQDLSGVFLSAYENTSISAENNITIKGESVLGDGVQLNSPITARNLMVVGISAQGAGVSIGKSVYGLKAKPITISGMTSIEGKSTTGSGLEILDTYFDSSTPATLTGTSVSGSGVYFSPVLNLNRPINLANAHLTGSSQTSSGVQNNTSVTVAGGSTVTSISNSGTGIWVGGKSILTVADGAEITSHAIKVSGGESLLINTF